MMKREEVKGILQGIFSDVFDDDSITLSEETDSSDIEGWDSLAHISLIEAIQDEFSISFDFEEVSSMKTVGNMIDIIMRKHS